MDKETPQYKVELEVSKQEEFVEEPDLDLTVHFKPNKELRRGENHKQLIQFFRQELVDLLGGQEYNDRIAKNIRNSKYGRKKVKRGDNWGHSNYSDYLYLENATDTIQNPYRLSIHVSKCFFDTKRAEEHGYAKI